ncbi:Protein brown [Lucilia cuprina]|nr:Protein brown [Lucilia cuprina]
MFNLRKSLKVFFEILVKVFKIIFHLVKISYNALAFAIKSSLRFLYQRATGFLRNVGDETGILALKLMFNRNLHIIERIFWFLTFVVAIYGALFITKSQIIRHLKSPTVISVDRNYRDWVGYMPAITLCYYDHIDSYKANEYILENWNVSIVDEEYFYFMDFLYAVVNASATNYADLAKFSEDERFDDVDLYDIITAIDKPFEQIINTFEGNFEISVTTAMTERGSCYIINSAIGEVLGASFKFSFQGFDDLKKPLKCKFGKQQCFIKIDLLESTGVIDVHSPFEISSTDSSFIALQKSDEIIASYKVVETIKTLCLAKCRAMMAMEMCDCVPFFYTFVDQKSCNPAGFECLLDFKWPVWALHICKCPNTCIEMEYTLQTVKKSSWGISNLDDSGKSDVVTSSFRWDLIPPKVRFRRDVVFSFEDLLVSFGGTLALFLGFSILSLIHFIYALVKRVFEDFYDLLRLIFMTFHRLWQNYMNRRKIKKDVVLVKEIRTTQEVSFLKKIKERREKFLKMRFKSSEDIIDLENNAGDLDLLENSHDSSVFEFIQKQTNYSFWQSCQNQKELQLLNDVSGHMKTGDLVAILGCSGAGKTTLLAAISQRLRGNLSGEIVVNGVATERADMIRISSFLPQFEINVQTFTAYEHLYFMSHFKMHRKTTKSQKHQRVNDLLLAVGLKNVAHTRIQQLSGGERKRLSLAEELITDPPFIFCDEPTTGLDSYNAYTVVKTLRHLCTRHRVMAPSLTALYGEDSYSSPSDSSSSHSSPHSSIEMETFDSDLPSLKALNNSPNGRYKKAIICSIHQPTSDIFELFTHIILMDAGRIIYQGRTEEAFEFFTRLNYIIPNNCNPADFYLKTISDSHTNRNDGQLIKAKYSLQTSGLYSNSWLLPKPYSGEYLTNMRNLRRQKHNENFDEYLDSILAMTDRLKTPISDRDLCETLIRNLKTEVRHELLHLEISSVSQLRKETRKTDRGRVSEIDGEDKDLDITDTGTDDICALQQIKCWNCDKDGHTKKIWWPFQVYLLLKRFVTDDSRNLKQGVLSMGFFMITSLTLAIMYSGVQGLTQTSIQDIGGSIFMLSTEMIFTFSYGVTYVFPSALPIMRREVGEGTYSLSAYYVAVVLSFIPMAFFKSYIFFGVVYSSIYLDRGFMLYLSMGLVLALSAVAATGYGLFLSTIFETEKMASECAAPFDLLFLIFGGAYYNVDSIPFLKYFSLFFYSNEALMYNFWINVDKIDCPQNEAHPCIKNGYEVLVRGSFRIGDDTYWTDCLGLVFVALVFNIIAYFFVRKYVKRSESKVTILLLKKEFSDVFITFSIFQMNFIILYKYLLNSIPFKNNLTLDFFFSTIV